MAVAPLHARVSIDDSEEPILDLARLVPPKLASSKWAATVRSHLRTHDADSDDKLSGAELWKALETMPHRIEALRPRFRDGDIGGVFEAVKAADINGNDSLETHELLHVIVRAAKMRK